MTDTVVPFPVKPPEHDDCCECGAPAALAVGYRGESAPVLQCVRCAVADPRSPFLHRKLEGCEL